MEPLQIAQPGSQDGVGAPVRALSAQDELSLALARQRELETERDEAERGWNSCKTTADQLRDMHAKAETRQRELEEAMRGLNTALDAYWNIGPDKPSQGTIKAVCAAQQRCAALLAPPTQNGAAP